MRKKIDVDKLLNRLMLAGGAVILGFTIFYGVVFGGKLFDGKKKETAATLQETTTIPESQAIPEDIVVDFFKSPYSDFSISSEIKNMLSEYTLLQKNATNLPLADKKVDTVLLATVSKDMDAYMAVRNIYDYFVYNFKLSENSFAEKDEIQNVCGQVGYNSEFDMEIVYRAQKSLTGMSGDSRDLACALTTVLCKEGFDAYYVNGYLIEDLSKEHGYVLVMIDGKQYLLDVANEKKTATKENQEYKYFFRDFSTLQNEYSLDGVNECLANFAKFAAMSQLGLQVKLSSGNESAMGAVDFAPGADNDNCEMAQGTINVMEGGRVNLAGTATGAEGERTWKLKVMIYDVDMNYIETQEIYSETTTSSYNECSYDAVMRGNIRLEYSVLDDKGRECKIAYTFRVKGEDETESVTEEYTTREIITETESMTEVQNTLETTSQQTQENNPTEVTQATTSAENYEDFTTRAQETEPQEQQETTAKPQETETETETEAGKEIETETETEATAKPQETEVTAKPQETEATTKPKETEAGTEKQPETELVSEKENKPEKETTNKAKK